MNNNQVDSTTFNYYDIVLTTYSATKLWHGIILNPYEDGIPTAVLDKFRKTTSSSSNNYFVIFLFAEKVNNSYIITDSINIREYRFEHLTANNLLHENSLTYMPSHKIAQTLNAMETDTKIGYIKWKIHFNNDYDIIKQLRY